MTAPMPLVAPVMNATLSCSRKPVPDIKSAWFKGI
jgi:hypothetical protein